MEQTIDLRAGFGHRLRMGGDSVNDVPQEALLVESARRGDREAFGRLYDLYARMVHGVLLTRVPPQEASDLVHDVFLQALRRLDSLRDPAAFPAWLAAIARNRARDHFRRRAPQEELPENLAGPASSEFEARAALAAIQSLPEAYRETLILRLVEGMTGDEIAARTGLKTSSVRVNLHRGLKQLREKLGW